MGRSLNSSSFAFFGDVSSVLEWLALLFCLLFFFFGGAPLRPGLYYQASQTKEARQTEGAERTS